MDPHEALEDAKRNCPYPEYKRAKTDVARFLTAFLDLPTASGVPDARWTEMAFAQMNTPDSVMISVDNKCRQRGWSFNESGIGVARSILVPKSTTMFVSYNQDESMRKIEYAQHIIAALDPMVRPTLEAANKTELKLPNGSQICSLPCKEPRGMPRPRMVMDEAAMYGLLDVPIFQAALGACMRDGCLRIGSTPKPSGMFRELATGEISPALLEFLKKSLPGFEIVTREWPWWVFDDLCQSPVSAAMNAPAMTTEQRVEQYGTDRLKTVYATYMITGDIAGFQQECECQWISEAAALIAPTYVYDAQRDTIDTPPLGTIAIGADFATRQDQTAFVVLHYHEERFRVIDIVRMRGADALAQTARLRDLVAQYKPFKIYGDTTDGFGKSVHGMLSTELPHFEGIDFTKQRKEEMVAVSVGAFVNRLIEIPRSDRTLADDIMSIRKVQTPTGHTKYDSPRTAKGHADSFWALALALYAMPRTGTSDFRYTPVATREVDWCKPEGGGEFVDFNSKHDDFDLPSSTRSGWGDF